MKIVEYGEGDPAWLEPETPEDEALLETAKREQWSLRQLMAQVSVTNCHMEESNVEPPAEPKGK